MFQLIKAFFSAAAEIAKEIKAEHDASYNQYKNLMDSGHLKNSKLNEWGRLTLDSHAVVKSKRTAENCKALQDHLKTHDPSISEP